jgi:hypothetical protein
MKLLTLDPSSTAIGYAVTDSDLTLHDVGVIRPDMARAVAEVRVLNMTAAVREILTEHADIEHVLLEKPSGHVHGRMKHAGGSGLSIYGMGVGAVLQLCTDMRPMGTQMIDCNVWTMGKSKTARARIIQARWPTYQWDQDKGMDAQDAVGMAIWFWGFRETSKQAKGDK